MRQSVQFKYPDRLGLFVPPLSVALAQEFWVKIKAVKLTVLT